MGAGGRQTLVPIFLYRNLNNKEKHVILYETSNGVKYRAEREKIYMKNEKGEKTFKLTEKQQKFADLYIVSLNVAEAYQGAYGDHLAYNTALSAGNRLLRNVSMKSYVNDRLEDLKSDRIADQEEVLEYFSSVMRGEARGGGLKGVGGGEEIIVHDIPPTISEKNKAAEMLGKRYALFTDKQEVNATVTPVFVDDIE